MSSYAIILGGGSGRRMRSDLNKIFLPLRGIPAIVRAIAPFTGFCAGAVVVAAADEVEDMQAILAKYGIHPDEVRLWGTGTPLREFLWSEEMADASVYILEHVDFKDTYREGSREVRNCHINIGTGKEITIAALARLIVEEVGFKGRLTFDSTKPDGTMRKLTDVSKLHALGWHHQVEIEEGVRRMYEWYLS